MDAAWPGPDTDGVEAGRIDIDEDDIAARRLGREDKAVIAQRIVERHEQAEQRCRQQEREACRDLHQRPPDQLPQCLHVRASA
jgi:hypothetical protein